jgi:hypothetical protein
MSVGAVAASATAPKSFTMVITPPSVAAGTTSTFSVKIGNKANVTMGAINLTVPPALTSVSATSPRGTVTVVGNQVQLRNLALGAGKFFTFTVTGVAPCVPVNVAQQQSTLTWFVMATTGANFTGTSFALDGTNSKKTTKVTGACSLAFVDGRQPGGAHPDEVLTATPFDTGGPAIQVEVLASGGGPSAFSTTVAMAIGVNAGDPDGSLGGTSSQPTSGGVASFGDLTIDQPGVGYTLVASAPGLASVASLAFTIADEAVNCIPDVDCVGELSDETVDAMVNAQADPSSPILTMSLTPGGIDCADYEEHSSTLEFFVTTDRTKEVTMTVDTGAYPDSEGYFPIGDFQVCYESPNGFTDRNGSENVNLGLLPDCDYEYPVAPCVLNREQSYYSTMGTVTFITPPGDPKGRV